MQTHQWFLILSIFFGILLLALIMTCRVFAPI